EKNGRVSGLWRYTELSQEIIDSGWLGKEGALEDEILATEARLGIELPPSYRNFLKVTNGWNNWQLGVLGFYSLEDIIWFRQNNSDWIETYLDGSDDEDQVDDEDYFIYGKLQDEYSFRVEYLESALQISMAQESEVILLNPEIIHEQEWEAWIFSDHIGVKRYCSFSEMIQRRGLVNEWV
ncbi:MAG: SMI1/KNR4 family protein, partial [Cyanothece sp. SIO2G6]|nr:SMI1/KNR4 family protein [Cyanothece sp. SIO2G6]